MNTPKPTTLLIGGALHLQDRENTMEATVNVDPRGPIECRGMSGPFTGPQLELIGELVETLRDFQNRFRALSDPEFDRDREAARIIAQQDREEGVL